MELFRTIILWVTGGLLFLCAVLLLRRPLKRVGRFVLHTGIWMLVLAVFSKVGGLIGVTLGVNLINGAVLALLGAPGFGLLLMLKWVLST